MQDRGAFSPTPRQAHARLTALLRERCSRFFFRKSLVLSQIKASAYALASKVFGQAFFKKLVGLGNA